MTIEIQVLLDKSQNRSVECHYSDTKFGPNGQPTGEKVDSMAGIILPGESHTYWIHSNRNLRIIENNVDHPIDKSEPVDS